MICRDVIAIEMLGIVGQETLHASLVAKGEPVGREAKLLATCSLSSARKVSISGVPILKEPSLVEEGSFPARLISSIPIVL